MNKDLYAILGVKRTASNDEIRRAYRKLAKDLHPDQNKNDKKSEEQFKKVSAAFAVLGNPEKRKRYDAGEIDAMGNERANPFYREYAGGGQGFGKEYAGGGGWRRRSGRFFRYFRRSFRAARAGRRFHHARHGLPL